ncbi:MAG: hypothetical protein KAS99_04050 [Candidatus Omnitrophica bacterium]|nr:hypothetical protein [Candidatus Omnitrophota bacterium]
MEKRRSSVLKFIKQLGRKVFTTREIAALSGKSLSVVTQALNNLEKESVLVKVYRGLWYEKGDKYVSPYNIIPFLLPRHRAYVSFVSALHLYGIVEQIPQVITLASLVHTKVISTKIGVFSFHRIAPSFFDGFCWSKGKGEFLIAEPEKALIDSLYLSCRKKKQFGYFPELHFSEQFHLKNAKGWIRKITNLRIRSCVQKKFEKIVEGYRIR